MVKKNFSFPSPEAIESVSTGFPPSIVDDARKIARVPWQVWCYALSSLVIILGIEWDLSWHRSIGRDTKYIPPHLIVYGMAILGQIACAYEILGAIFRKNSDLQTSHLKIWNIKGSLGAFIGVWSATAMVVISFLDDWWHLSFGLDVRIITPVHILILVAVVVFQFGSLTLIAKYLNRSSDEAAQHLYIWFAIVIAGLLLQLGLMERQATTRIAMHSSTFYLNVALVFPAIIVGLARRLPFRWSATFVTAIYTTAVLGMIWILPLFPADPKLGPVIRKVTEFIPPDFPLLFIVPAFFIDLTWPYVKQKTRSIQAGVCGILFLITFAVAQWNFADFLMSSASKNWFFGKYYYPFSFFLPTEIWERNLAFRPLFSRVEWMAAFAAAVVSCWIGLAIKDWLIDVRR